MVTELNIASEPQSQLSMNPKKFALWLFMVSIVMIFAALTSAYLVRMAEGNWLLFEMPDMLTITTVILFISSITMHIAYKNAQKDNLSTLKVFVSITFGLGILFLLGQYEAWKELVAMKVFFVGNPSGSFLYVLTGVHAFHLVSGLVYLLIVLINSFRLKIHSKNMVQMEMCTTYWHFLDGLWIYLFLFLKLNH
ncbi:MAG: cytochrome c oxidase subunit 3 [Cytophagales bacterium]|nr:cytochrome c oxidase subunit 3 [Cytophagales bacterium]